MVMTAADTTTGDAPAITVLPADPEPSSADEINHRISNSLQLLSAMVSVEARGIEDPAARAALDMTQRRISAIASVHRQLYRTHEASTVDLGAYLDELGYELEAGYANAAAGRRVLVDASSITVTAMEATAIGIMVSELVGNACKYAYAPNEPGDVRIALRPMLFGGYILEVEDSGRGRVPDATPEGSGLGSRLIDMMATRLGGWHGYDDARPGTRFIFCVGKR
ncbi:sensor histidine kinase [Sphingomonas sp. JC676]|uniref:sensor histidine kinase n=1 Tax=Sphingomonas sp. JC676 TaxID=2768065 RepID=UPI0016580CDE|nr:sensor histidine kinase [Sphingomonas sp. JC676]MBC9032639.1 sensor histidine kinase [Sphingomonas sp. JC676]